MHVLGKVAAWLVVVLTIVAAVLTGEMVQVRNSWVKKATDLKAEYEKNEQELQTQRRKLRELEKQLARLMLDWNRVWPVVEVAPLNVQAGQVRVSIGVEQRLKKGRTLFLFQPARDGKGTEFVGPFVVEVAGQGQSALRPSWRFRPGEPQQWRFGKGWRVRENIPTAALSAFRDLEVAFAEADANFADRQDYLAMQERLKREAQEHLNYRWAELHGTDEQPGLVQQIDGEEKARNERLLQVDQLRRRVKAEVARFQQLLAENRRLAQELQETAVPVTANR